MRSSNRPTAALLVFALSLFLAPAARAQDRQRLDGYCERGGQRVVTSGLQSSTQVQQSCPACTIEVFLAGTATPATIYADLAGTPKANPFTADAVTGYYFFYGDPGRYDIRLSGPCISTPFTLGDQWIVSNSSVGPHNLLSPSHPDTIPAAPQRGDVLVAGATAFWQRLARGTANQLLAINTAGTDPVYKTLLGSGGITINSTDSTITLGCSGCASGASITPHIFDGFSFSTSLPQRTNWDFRTGFRITDNPGKAMTELTTSSVPTGFTNVQTEYLASGSFARTTGSINAASTTLNVATNINWRPGMGIYVAGAGPSGGPLVTTVAAVSSNGLTITLGAAATGTVSGALVQHDDTAALQQAVNDRVSSALGFLWLPRGYYRLSSSLVLPASNEGNTLTLQGAGWDFTSLVFEHGGDGIRDSAGLTHQSMIFRDLTITTGIPGNEFNVDPNNRGHGIRITGDYFNGIMDQFKMERVRVNGWGRYGMWVDNMQIGWIDTVIFRLNKSGAIAMVAPDPISPNKQCNSNVVRNAIFDQAPGVLDLARTRTDGAMGAGSTTLTSATASFVPADRGKFIQVQQAGVNNVTLWTFIDQVIDSSTVVLAHRNHAPGAISGATFTIHQTNVASFLGHRVGDLHLDTITVQGNYVGGDVANDSNAIRIANSSNMIIENTHEEDNAGFGGFAFKCENCRAVTVQGWAGNAPSDLFPTGAHQGDFDLRNVRSFRVTGSNLGSRTNFMLDADTVGVSIDSSQLTDLRNLYKLDSSGDRLTVGAGVTIFQDTNPVASNTAGNEYLYDSWYGENLLKNGLFLDGANNLADWTASLLGTDFTMVTTAPTRYGTYVRVNTQALGASISEDVILTQQISIPDSFPGGQYTLGFDYYIEDNGTPINTQYYTEVRLTPSVGAETGYRIFGEGVLSTGVWFPGQIRCFLGAGASRTITVIVKTNRGPSAPRVRLSNFRLLRGKHAWGAGESSIGELRGGVVRSSSGVNFEPWGAASGQTTELRFKELEANGQHHVALKAADSLAGDVTWRLPLTDAAGAMRSDGAGNLSFGPNTLATGSASLDFTALAAGACEVLTLAVTGAADGDAVTLGVPNALATAGSKTLFFGFVSAANTISVRRCNIDTVATPDPAAATVKASVTK